MQVWRGGVQVIQAAELDVLSLDWSGEEHYVATGADGGKVHVYDVRRLAGAEKATPLLEFQQFTRQQSAVLTVAFSPRQKVRCARLWHALLRAGRCALVCPAGPRCALLCFAIRDLV